MDTQELLSGKALKLYAIIVGNECLVRQFISSLSEKDRKQTIKRLEHRADKLDIYNEEIFRHLGDGIYELKTRNRVRIFCFWGGKESLILTHGLFKPKPKVLRIEKNRAIAWRTSYLTDKKNVALQIITAEESNDEFEKKQ